MTREARERLLTGLSCVLPGRAALTLTPSRPDVRTHMSLAVWVIGVVVALVALIWLARKFADRLARPIAPSEASRRWADRLRRIVEVDPLACIRCGGTMRIVACITDVVPRKSCAMARIGARSPHSVRRRPHLDALRSVPGRPILEVARYNFLSVPTARDAILTHSHHRGQKESPCLPEPYSI